MTEGWRRGPALIAAMVIGMLLPMTGTAVADGHDHHPKCAVGEAKGNGTSVIPGGIPFNTFRFTVCRNGPEPTDVTGSFAARTEPTLPLGAGDISIRDKT